MRAEPKGGQRLVPEQDLPKRERVVDHGWPRYRLWIFVDPREISADAENQGGTAKLFRP